MEWGVRREDGKVKGRACSLDEHDRSRVETVEACKRAKGCSCDEMQHRCFCFDANGE